MDLDSEYDVVGDLDEPDLFYEFCTLRVYRRKSDNKLFYATDSGCSCPYPFENTTVADLEPYSVYVIQEWAEDHRADASSLIKECEKIS
jgi:hypothetical protein